MIDSFEGGFFFLSNFYVGDIEYKEVVYTSAEAAFQAQKTLDPVERERFQHLTPAQSKHLGRRVKLRPNWEDIKETVMLEVLMAKFTQNHRLLKLLLQTGDRKLVEGNWWGDRYWGVCDGVGKNRLGILLMQVRKTLRKNESNKERGER